MLSVVIPTYRKPDLLDRTLAALSTQVPGLSVEVVVVDDGSGDGRTPAVIESWSRRLPLVVAGGDRNEGRARARNRGWRMTRGRWVLFLDDDIVLAPGSLEAHARAQQADEAVYLGRVVTAPEIVDSPLFDYLDTRGIAKLPPDCRVPARYLLTQNVSMPRSALEAVGGFDEEFGAYGFEDMELGFRLEDRCGLIFRSLWAAVGEHVHHHTLHEYLEKKERCGQETLPQLAQLHPGRLAEMRLDLLPGLEADAGTGRRLLGLLLRGSWRVGGDPLARGLLERLGRALPSGLRHPLYDYLVLAAYARGLRRREAAILA